MTSRRTSAISAVAALLATLLIAPAIAQQSGVGYVSNLSGPLFAVKSDGSRRVLSTQSQVQPGDTLITEEKTYARVRFTDTSEVTLRPATQFQVENYSFDREAPEKDNIAFRLFKGALRTVTGLVGRRGNQNAYRMHTATATVGIRGTVFGVTVCVPGTCGGLAPGTYVNVIEGQVSIAPPPPVPVAPPPGVALPPGAPPPAPSGAPPAAAGPSTGPATGPAGGPSGPPAGGPPSPPSGAPPVSAPPAAAPPAPAPVLLAAGQFGYVPPAGPPVQLPGDPGVGRLFTPPASFVQRQEAPPPVAQQPGAPAARPVTRPSSGECEVR